VIVDVFQKAKEHFPGIRQQAIAIFKAFLAEDKGKAVAQDANIGAKLFWMKGNAGAGKSVLSSKLFQHLCSDYQNANGTTSVQSMFMCKHNRQERQNIFSIIASLAYQFSLQNSTFAEISFKVRPFIRKTTDHVQEVIQELLFYPLQMAFDAKTLTQAVIFIDALDELLPPVRTRLLSSLLSKQMNSLSSLPFVKIVVSSRLDDDIVRSFCQSAEQLIPGDDCIIPKTEMILDGSKQNADDIGVVARERLHSLVAAESLDSVVSALVKQVDGNFRLLEMMIQNARQEHEENKTNSNSENKKYHFSLDDAKAMKPATLYGEYERCFDLLRKQTETKPNGKVNDADSMLSWDQIHRLFAIVSAAQEPLTVYQLCAVLQSAEKQVNDHPFAKHDSHHEFVIGCTVELTNASHVKLAALINTVYKANGMLRITKLNNFQSLKSEVSKLPPTDSTSDRIPEDCVDLLLQAMGMTVEVFHKSVHDWIRETDRNKSVFCQAHQFITVACLRDILQRKQDKKQLEEMLLFIPVESIDTELVIQNAIFHPLRMYGIAYALEHAIEGCLHKKDEDDKKVDFLAANLHIVVRLATSLAYMDLRVRSFNLKQMVVLLAQAGDILDTFNASNGEWKMWKQSISEIFAFARKNICSLVNANKTDCLWPIAFNSPSTSLMYQQAKSQFDRHNSFIIENVPDYKDPRLQIIQYYDQIPKQVVFSPDGTMLATAYEYDNIILWNVKTGQQVLPKPLTTSVRHFSVAFSPDGDMLASGSKNDTVILWNVKTGEQIRALIGHKDVVSCVAFSPDGSMLASGSNDNSIIIWNVKNGKQVLSAPIITPYSEVTRVAFSPDGTLLASTSHNWDPILWHVKSGERVFPEPVNENDDIDNNDTDEGISAVSVPLRGHTDSVHGIAFSPDGSKIATGSDDKTIIIWNVTTGLPVFAKPLTGHTAAVNSVAFSPDGSMLVSGSNDQSINMWDMKTGLCQSIPGHTKKVTSVVMSPDGRMIASASDDISIIVWDIDACKQVRPKSVNEVNSVMLSRDDKMLIAASQYNIVLWNVDTGQQILARNGYSSILTSWMSPDNCLVACQSQDNAIILWNVQTGEQVLSETLSGHSSFITCAAFSLDGSMLASGSCDNSIILWNVKNGKQVFPAAFTGHSDSVDCIAFSPDGTLLASASNNCVILWFVKTGDRVFPESPRDDNSDNDNDNDNNQSDSGKNCKKAKNGVAVPLRGHSGCVKSIAFSPDGSKIATGSDDNTIIIWNVTSGLPVLAKPLTGHTAAVNSIAFSPDGSMLVSGSYDQSIMLWDVKTGNQITTLNGHSCGVYSVAFSHDGLMIVSGSSDQSIVLWSVNPAIKSSSSSSSSSSSASSSSSSSASSSSSSSLSSASKSHASSSSESASNSLLSRWSKCKNVSIPLNQISVQSLYKVNLA
jgi:WD40 repeat protein